MECQGNSGLAGSLPPETDRKSVFSTFFSKLTHQVVDIGRKACTCIIICLKTGVGSCLQKFLLKDMDFVEHAFGHLKIAI